VSVPLFESALGSHTGTKLGTIPQWAGFVDIVSALAIAA